MERLKQLSLYIFLGLLAYMPFHIFLSTWIGTSFQILNLAKIAKDIVLVVGFGAALAVSIKQAWFRQLFRDKLTLLILVYAVLTLFLALLRPTDQDAEILGIVYNLRFLLFFHYALLLSRLFEVKIVKSQAVRIVLVAATITLFFGIIQYSLLPNDALRHVGYDRTNGVLPAFFIDEKPDLERSMSTLRDPNSLGSYVIIIGTIAFSLLIKTKNRYLKRTAMGLFILSLMCLWFTFSRSAWLGFMLATGLILVIGFGHQKIPKKAVKYAGASILVILTFALVGLFAFRDTYLVKNVVFHADESTVLEDPNQLRTRFWRESAENITDNPIGHGPGTAGLASIRNNEQGVVLNENYYLQIGHEIGVAGLVIFLAIIYLVATRLFVLKDHTLALALFASFIGLIFTNFLVHIWSNEAVAYTWWGLAGLVLGNTNNKRKRVS